MKVAIMLKKLRREKDSAKTSKRDDRRLKN